MKKLVILLGALILAGLAALIAAYLSKVNLGILNPKGTIAEDQKNLIFISVFLMLIVVIPVYVMTFWFAWRYREGNKKGRYTPDWDSHKGLEATWWLVPLAIISILSVIAWQSSHRLDPFKPLDSALKPLTVEVVALQWKWLFLYPEQNVASINHLQIPKDRPINFVITSDAPMNSFWIPQLGGQIYAMAGMTTRLHLDATTPGFYEGYSANISGEGFADMRFSVMAGSQTEFDLWVTRAKATSPRLTIERYNQLAKPAVFEGASQFASSGGQLFDQIVMKYMMPSHRAALAGYHGVTVSENIPKNSHGGSH